MTYVVSDEIFTPSNNEGARGRKMRKEEDSGKQLF